jgi:N-acetyl sugar amidotransferase
MDGSNPHIVFDAQGVCNCCTDAYARMPFEWFPGNEGRRQLNALAERLRAAGHGKPYDAMIGLSGGVDSAYLAHLLRAEYGLRLLAVHVDGGWNTEAAVRNIEILVRALRIDLHTYVVEWEEMRDLQLAFLRASVLNQDIPQDHAFFSTLYRSAGTFGVRDFLSGVNFSSECIVPPNWGYPAMDGRHVRAIHAHFGREKLRTFPVMGALEYLWMTRVRRQLTIHRPLNFLDYNKAKAKALLMDRYGYKDYGGKHNESRFTKFYQEIYLPERYGFDKRRLHLSSQIVSGQVTRWQALSELATPVCDPEQARHELKFVAKKLRIPLKELQALIAQPRVEHEHYPNTVKFYRLGADLKRLMRRSGGAR